jgi:phage terminase small subunit
MSDGRFQPGNTAALKDGTQSPRTVAKRAIQVREELRPMLEELPQIIRSDGPLVDLTVDVYTKLTLISERLEQETGGSLISKRGGKPHPSAEMYMRVTARLLQCYDRLGVGPLARSQGMANLGVAHRGLAGQLADRRIRLANGDE